MIETQLGFCAALSFVGPEEECVDGDGHFYDSHCCELEECHDCIWHECSCGTRWS